MINWDRLAALQNDVGAEDLDEVIDLFFEEVGPVIKRLSQSQTPNTLARELHFLKSCAINIGFEDFANLCHQGEMAAEKDMLSAINIPETITAYEASKQRFLAGLPRFKSSHPE